MNGIISLKPPEFQVARIKKVIITDTPEPGKVIPHIRILRVNKATETIFL